MDPYYFELFTSYVRVTLICELQLYDTYFLPFSFFGVLIFKVYFIQMDLKYTENFVYQLDYLVHSCLTLTQLII